jgi:hypothetical protein
MGTYAVGEAARYYYERGKEPPPEAYARFREDALRLYGDVNAQLKALLAARTGGPASSNDSAAPAAPPETAPPTLPAGAAPLNR